MRLIEENGLAVPELKRSALGAMAETAWKKGRPQLLATLDESNAEPELRFEKLREHDLQRGTLGPLILWSFTLDGAYEIVDTACRAANVDTGKFIAGLSADRVQRIAMEMLGMEDRDKGEPSPATVTTDPSR